MCSRSRTICSFRVLIVLVILSSVLLPRRASKVSRGIPLFTIALSFFFFFLWSVPPSSPSWMVGHICPLMIVIDGGNLGILVFARFSCWDPSVMVVLVCCDRHAEVSATIQNRSRWIRDAFRTWGYDGRRNEPEASSSGLDVISGLGPRSLSSGG